MILSNEYTYSVEYEQNGNYSCAESGCDDEGICRCYKITEVIINWINLQSITTSIFKEITQSNIQHDREKKLTSIMYDYDVDIVTKYCINRVLTINKIWNVDNWEASWSGSWYGDEIDSVNIISSCLNKISNDISNILDLETMEDKINYVLLLEYGHLLEKIKDKKYSIIEVNKSDIFFGQKKHYEKVQQSMLEYYSDGSYDSTIPRGVCCWDGQKWRVLDGYHRLSETKKDKILIIGIK